MPTDPAFLESLTRRKIGRDIGTERFACEPNIDWFLREVASDHHEKRISSVVCWLAGNDLAGYMTTSAHILVLESGTQREKHGLRGIFFRKDSQRHHERFPALLIGMLGVCDRYARRGLGLHMVKYAVGEGYALSRRMGCRLVVVDADLSESAQSLYRAAGFYRVEKQKRQTTISMFYDLGPLTTEERADTEA